MGKKRERLAALGALAIVLIAPSAYAATQTSSGDSGRSSGVLVTVTAPGSENPPATNVPPSQTTPTRDGGAPTFVKHVVFIPSTNLQTGAVCNVANYIPFGATPDPQLMATFGQYFWEIINVDTGAIVYSSDPTCGFAAPAEPPSPPTAADVLAMVKNSGKLGIGSPSVDPGTQGLAGLDTIFTASTTTPGPIVASNAGYTVTATPHFEGYTWHANDDLMGFGSPLHYTFQRDGNYKIVVVARWSLTYTISGLVSYSGTLPDATAQASFSYPVIQAVGVLTQ